MEAARLASVVMPLSLVVACSAYLAAALLLVRLRSLPIVVRRLLVVYVFYGLIAFMGRGAFLAVVEPRPALDDPMPVQALYLYGYDAGITTIIWFQTLSLACIAISARGLSLLMGSKRSSDVYVRLRLSSPVVVGVTMVYSLGWAFRLLTFVSTYSATTPSMPTGFGKVADLALLVPAFLFLACEWWERGSTQRMLLPIVVALEVVWTLVGDTKAPAVALLVAAYLGAPSRTNWAGIMRVSSMLAISAVLIIFSIVNGARDARFASFSRTEALAGAAKDILRSPGRFTRSSIERVLVRFDGINAASDAYLSPSNQYMNGWEVGERVSRLLVPSVLSGSTKESPAVLWGSRMAQVNSGVSLAEGVAPEGFAIGGAPMLVLWSLALGSIIGWAGVLLARARFLSISGLASIGFIASPALFERGLLGIVESAVNSLQLAALAWIVLSLAVTASPRQKALPRVGLYPQDSLVGIKKG